MKERSAPGARHRLALNDRELLLAGALPAAALALASELLFESIEYFLRRSRR